MYFKMNNLWKESFKTVIVNDSTNVNKPSIQLWYKLAEHKHTTSFCLGKDWWSYTGQWNPSPLNSLISKGNTYIDKR